MKKFTEQLISIVLTVALVLSVVPVIGMAETGSVQLGFINADMTKLNNNEPQAPNIKYNCTYLHIRNKSDDAWRAYFQIDLSGYEYLLTDENTTIDFSISMGGPYSTSSCYDFAAYILNDNVDEYRLNPDITSSQAEELGLHTVTEAQKIAERTETGSTSGQFKTTIDKTKLLTALNSGTDNSLVTVVLMPLTSTQYSWFRIDDISSSHFQINYDTSVATEQAKNNYLNSVKSEMTWDAIMPGVSKDNVKGDVSLPNKYRGVDITWSADADGVVGADGTINAPTAGVTTNLTATISYMGAIDTITYENVTMPADVNSVQLGFINADMTRINNANPQEPTVYGGGTYVYVQNAWAAWRAYFQIDLSGYEYLLADPNSTVDFSISLGGPYSTSYCYDFAAYILNDNVDEYSLNPDITSSQATQLGLHTVTEAQKIAERTATDAVKNVQFKTTIDKTKLLTALNSGTDNSLVTVVLMPLTSTDFNYFRVDNIDWSHLQINYPKSTDVEQAKNNYLNSVKTELTWDTIMPGVGKDAVNGEVPLPNKYRGVNITWTADAEGVVEADGTINAPKEGVTTNITANLSYNGVTDTITYDAVTVKDELRVLKINYETIRKIESGSGNQDTNIDAWTRDYRSFLMTSRVMYDTSSARGDEHVFMRWDLKDNLQIIDKATKITINIPNSDTKYTVAGAITVLNDRSDNWDPETITYNSSIKSGMYTDPGLYTESNVFFNSDTTIVDTVGMADGIKSALRQNPDQGKVTFRISSSTYHTCGFKIDPNDVPYLNVYYYNSDLVDDAAYSASKAQDILWTDITGQDIDNVVTDITLPSTWYGKTIAWTSDNPAIVINNTCATVTPGSTATIGKLTATIDGKITEFDVTVPARTIAVKSERKTNIDYATYNYSTGYIYVNEVPQGEYTILLATYDNDATLRNVKVLSSAEFTINKGLNIVVSDDHDVFGNGSTKIIIVNNTDELIPLTVAR